MRLWFKIAFLNVAVVVSLGILTSIGVRDIVINAMRQELTRHGESIVKNLSDRIADSVLLDDFYKIQEAIDDVGGKEKDVEYIFVTDKNGRLSAHTFKNGYPPGILQWNPLATNKLLSIQLLDTEKGFIRDVAVRIFESMHPELHIGIKEGRIAQTLNRTRNLIISLTIIITLFGSFLSFSLSRLTTKPLNTLVEFTHNLAKGDFGKSIEIKSRDEVGDLAATFNNLSHELKLYRERREESYKQMLRTEKLTALGRLSAGLAHEIRNPLTSIKVLFQAFRDNPALTKEDMRVVLSAVGQMDHLLKRFLRFAKGDEFSLSDVDINSLIKQVISLTRFQIKEQSINVNMELGKLSPVKADKALMQQAMLNIVLNAIEAMPHGGSMTLSSNFDNGHLVVSIRDTGHGIPENIRYRIFDPFFTTKSDGTGLGLSIAYNIVSLHNGNIGLESDAQGTTFTITLPTGVQI